ncbi:hypothetical protein ILYODFUR_033030, partial [Ilyodon furcidens]
IPSYIPGSLTVARTAADVFLNFSICQVPAFKHGNITVNESYAACFYLESQFKPQGTKLIPDGTEEQALMYQRMFEGLTFYDKLCFSCWMEISVHIAKSGCVFLLADTLNLSEWMRYESAKYEIVISTVVIASPCFPDIVQ